MLWVKRQPERNIAAAELPLTLDDELFQHHFLQLTKEMTGAGVEDCLAILNAKQSLYAAALKDPQSLRLEEIELLLEQVFTARRKLFPVLAAFGEAQTGQALAQLLRGNEAVTQRMHGFVTAMPIAPGENRNDIKAANKVRRAAWDFAAELLHFHDPVRYPLMARWVWDKATMSGALREFIRGNDHMSEIPFDNRVEIFEAARRWLGKRIADQGIYRDIHFWIDLVLAQAYLGYFRAVAEGNLGVDFGRGISQADQLKKLLGIDALRKDGRSRVKKEASIATH
ncbi:MAG: hypothetical protein AB1513_06655 [Pseudomonadota bacterium]